MWVPVACLETRKRDFGVFVVEKIRRLFFSD